MPSQALESLPMLMPVSGAAYSWYIKLPTSPKILCHKFLKCLQESKQTYLPKDCHTRGHTWERADKVHWGFTWCQTDKDVRREVQAHRISHSSRRTRGDSVRDRRDRGVDKSEQVPASSKDETICRVLSSFSSPSVQTFDIQSGIRVILKVKAICLLAQLAHDWRCLSQYLNWIQISKTTGCQGCLLSVDAGEAPSFWCGFASNINSSHKSTLDHKTKTASQGIKT